MRRVMQAIGRILRRAAAARPRYESRPVCDVCGAAGPAGREFCPECGADFTDDEREYHELGVPHPDYVPRDHDDRL